MKEKSYNLFGSTWIIQFVDEVVIWRNRESLKGNNY